MPSCGPRSRIVTQPCASEVGPFLNRPLHCSRASHGCASPRPPPRPLPQRLSKTTSSANVHARQSATTPCSTTASLRCARGLGGSFALCIPGRRLGRGARCRTGTGRRQALHRRSPAAPKRRTGAAACPGLRRGHPPLVRQPSRKVQADIASARPPRALRRRGNVHGGARGAGPRHAVRPGGTPMVCRTGRCARRRHGLADRDPRPRRLARAAGVRPAGRTTHRAASRAPATPETGSWQIVEVLEREQGRHAAGSETVRFEAGQAMPMNARSRTSARCASVCWTMPTSSAIRDCSASARPSWARRGCDDTRLHRRRRVAGGGGAHRHGLAERSGRTHIGSERHGASCKNPCGVCGSPRLHAACGVGHSGLRDRASETRHYSNRRHGPASPGDRPAGLRTLAGATMGDRRSRALQGAREAARAGDERALHSSGRCAPAAPAGRARGHEGATSRPADIKRAEDKIRHLQAIRDALVRG